MGLPRVSGNLISVVIPVYNGAEFLYDTLESVYAQTVAPGEVVVVDDGSTDESPRIVRQFQDQPGFRAIRQQNAGEASARNIGLEHATGEYVALLDQDDRWRHEKVERQLEGFDPSWAMSFTAYERITATESKVEVHETWDPDPRAVVSELERWPALGTCSTMLIRRDALLRVGGFEQVWPFGTDWLMGLRLAADGNRIGYLSEPLTVYRWHGKNISHANTKAYYDCACAVFDRYGDARLRAWHRLNAALYAREQRDRTEARRRILEAARIRPRSIRPGWVRLL